MTKIQTIEAMIAAGTITTEAGTELIALLATSKTKTITNPDKLDDDGKVVERYCNLHKSYEPIENFSEKGTKKECKAGVWRWNQINKNMKLLVDEMLSVDNDLKLAEYKEYKTNINDLKASRVPGADGYDIETDMNDYKLATTKEES